MVKLLPPLCGPVKVQKDNFTRIGIDVLQNDDGTVEITQKSFTDLLCPIATTPSLWRDRNRTNGDEELQTCQSKLGELCWLATASRPDIRTRLPSFSANLVLKEKDKMRRASLDSK